MRLTFRHPSRALIPALFFLRLATASAQTSTTSPAQKSAPVQTNTDIPATGAAAASRPLPYLEASRGTEERVNDLVARMTLTEKIGQMMNATPAIPRLGIPEYNWWNECLHGVARSGLATVFPQAIGLGAAWDEDMMLRVPGEIHLYQSDDHHGNWLDSIASSKPPITNAEMAHRACSTCLIHHIAMKLKRKVYWDPVTERFKNDDEANRLLSRPQRPPYIIKG